MHSNAYNQGNITPFCLQTRHTTNLFVCLFVWGFSSNSRIFHSYGDVTIAAKGCKLSSEDSLACHTYCDTWHPLVRVISENP